MPGIEGESAAAEPHFGWSCYLVTMKSSVAQVGSLIGSTAAALTSAAASICCIGPLAIAILGVNGAIIAAGVKPYRFYILAVSLVLLGMAWWAVYRPLRVLRGECSVRVGRFTRTVLWITSALWVAAVGVQFAADKYWL